MTSVGYDFLGYEVKKTIEDQYGENKHYFWVENGKTPFMIHFYDHKEYKEDPKVKSNYEDLKSVTKLMKGTEGFDITDFNAVVTDKFRVNSTVRKTLEELCEKNRVEYHEYQDLSSEYFYLL